MCAMKDCSQEAVSTVRNVYMNKYSSLMDNSTMDIGVNYDGSWHSRGYTSQHGVEPS